MTDNNPQEDSGHASTNDNGVSFIGSIITPSEVLEADEYEDYDVIPNRCATRQSRVLALLMGGALLAAIGLGTYFAMDRDEVPIKKDEVEQDSTSSASLVEVTLEELVLHSIPEDCWEVFHGNVYNLTDYAPREFVGSTLSVSFRGR